MAADGRRGSGGKLFGEAGDVAARGEGGVVGLGWVGEHDGERATRGQCVRPVA